MVNFLFYKQGTKKTTDQNGFLFRQKKKEPIPQFDCKDTNKRAKNIKFTLIFFTAATRNKRCLRRRNIYVPKGVRLAAPKCIFARSAKYQQTSKKYKVYFDIFQSGNAK